MAKKQKHTLVKGGAPPDEVALDSFWQRARTALGDRNLPDSFQVRRIGGDHAVQGRGTGLRRKLR